MALPRAVAPSARMPFRSRPKALSPWQLDNARTSLTTALSPIEQLVRSRWVRAWQAGRSCRRGAAPSSPMCAALRSSVDTAMAVAFWGAESDFGGPASEVWGSMSDFWSAARMRGACCTCVCACSSTALELRKGVARSRQSTASLTSTPATVASSVLRALKTTRSACVDSSSRSHWLTRNPCSTLVAGHSRAISGPGKALSVDSRVRSSPCSPRFPSSAMVAPNVRLSSEQTLAQSVSSAAASICLTPARESPVKPTGSSLAMILATFMPSTHCVLAWMSRFDSSHV
mmetsp:Transcript_127737/g.190358  ORF Transcript_127737/g.190358 Transcript_127737/m.190358 type:complete len:287 (-) Transcript_127737:247-1107(-)